VRIKTLIEMNQEISQEQVYQELLKEKSDTELHEMSEEEIEWLVRKIILRLRKKMDKEVKTIYI
jgi:hypothetical protein